MIEDKKPTMSPQVSDVVDDAQEIDGNDESRELSVQDGIALIVQF